MYHVSNSSRSIFILDSNIMPLSPWWLTKNCKNHIKLSNPHCPWCIISFTTLHIASSPHTNASFIIGLRIFSQSSFPCTIQLLGSPLNALSWWLTATSGLLAGICSTPAWSSRSSLTATGHASWSRSSETVKCYIKCCGRWRLRFSIVFSQGHS